MANVLKQTGRSFFGLVSSAVGNQPCQIGCEFYDTSTGNPAPKVRLRPLATAPAEEMALYTAGESGNNVCGKVKVAPAQPGQKLDHQGIRVQLVGVIELASAGVKNHEFLSMTRELAAAGDVRTEAEFDFNFTNVDLALDSYRGGKVRLRYYVKVLVVRGMNTISAEFPFWVQNPCPAVPDANDIKLEVGIEGCLHLEFQYSSSVYGINDCVVGSVNFRLVLINLKSMELEVRRKEVTTMGNKHATDVQTLYKYEIMDGAPVQGTVIPVRLYLGPLELSPSYDNVHNKFSIKYFLNLVLVDSEDRRYFKQHEITLIRKGNEGPPRVVETSDASSSDAVSQAQAPES